MAAAIRAWSGLDYDEQSEPALFTFNQNKNKLIFYRISLTGVTFFYMNNL